MLKLLFLLVLFHFQTGMGITIPVTVQKRAASFSSPSGILFEYGSTSSASSSESAQPDVVNVGNNLYRTDIKIGGQVITVQIDTGSTDLWVFPQETLKAITLSEEIKSLNLTYGAGSAAGPVAFGPFSIGEYSIDSQAFVNATQFTEFQDILFSQGVFGILGLAFNTGDGASPILSAVVDAYHNSTQGQSPLGNIFYQDKSLPNFISIMLGRSGDLDETSDGMFTISEYVHGFENIGNMPKLERYDTGSQARWTVLLDGVSVNGKNLSLSSSLKGVPKGKSVVLLDTGATQARLSQTIVDAIYGGMPNAIFDKLHGYWIVPCNSTADVHFTFGGQEIPIHPLDLTEITTFLTSDNKKTVVCTSIPYITNNFIGQGFDASLGDAFLRNVYSLFDYGDFEDPEKDDINNAYIQFLPLENPKDSLVDFNDSRKTALARSAPEATFEQIRQTLGSAASSTDGPSSPDRMEADGPGLAGGGDSAGQMGWFGPVVVGLLGGNVLVGVVLCVLALVMCVRKGASTGRRARGAPMYVPVGFKVHE